MEAGTATTDSRGAKLSERLRAPVSEAGELATFSARAFLGITRVWPYAAEIFRQCSLLILGSSVVLVSLVAVIGGECGLFGIHLLRPVGAVGFVGGQTVICGIREMFPYIFAYIFAAKVGCGLVAEIGSMRIGDEIDAVEATGIDSMAYVITTRLLAVLICVPLIFVLALVAGAAGAFFVAVYQFGDVSSGQFLTGYWTSQSLQDNLFSLIKVVTMAGTIALVGMYYGYRARGGPVGVGGAVARSMVVNLVLIHVIGAFWSSLFWGTQARLPAGG